MTDGRLTRRRWLRALAGVGAACGLAGCSGDGDDPLSGSTDTSTTAAPTGTATPTERPTGTATEPSTRSRTTTRPFEELELLHGWSAGDGKDALAALVEGFREAHPDVEFASEPVEVGTRTNLREVVRARLRNGEPPSTWQAWPGGNLQQYRDDLGDVDAVWEATGMTDRYRTGTAAPARLRGRFVAVPIDVHRVNDLFYNRTVLDEAGVRPGDIRSPADLADAMATVDAETDAVPIAHQTRGPWSTVQLWESVVLARAGPDGYADLVAGDGDRATVEASLSTLRTYEQYYPVDADAISWVEAAQRFHRDEAAFLHQGDWAAALLADVDNFAYGMDWGHMAFPGTAGSYLFTMDSFPYPVPNPSPRATRTFLRYCGTAEAQVRFNEEKGAIPPRTDADVTSLSRFQQDQFADYVDSEAQVPSVVHGVAVTPGVRSAVTDAFSAFLDSSGDTGTAGTLLEAFGSGTGADGGD